MKILYCEDDKELMEASLLLFQEIFDASTKITSCHNSIQALELLKFNKYDLIISDCDMPTMSGKELFQYLQEKRIRTPFIICTGREKSYFQIELMNNNFFYISKPFLSSDFQRIKMIINNRSAQK